MSYVPQQPITITFKHGTDDLTDSDWEKCVFCNGQEKSTNLSITQVKSGGYYKATFTPSAQATWDIHMEEAAEEHHFTFNVQNQEILQLIRARVAQLEALLRSK